MEELLYNGFTYGDILSATIKHEDKIVYQEKLPLEKYFSYVKQAEAVVYTNELLKAGLAISMGSFRDTYQVDFGADWIFELNK